jgi:hypothetical protein
VKYAQPFVEAGFNVKGLKNVRGHGGEPCPAFTLTFNGKAVCAVATDTWGGPMHFEWAKGTEAVKNAFYALVAKAPPCMDFGTPLEVNDEMVCDDLANYAKLMKNLAKSTCFRLPDTETGTYYTYSGPFTAEMKAHVEKKHPGAIILNENPFA